MERRFVESF